MTEVDRSPSGHSIAGFPLPLVLIPLLSLTGALAGYLIPDSMRANVITFCGFGLCLLLLVAICVLVGKIHGRSLSRNMLTSNLAIIALSTVVVLIYSQTDHRANKVILDELILQSTAMQLLGNNTYQAPQFSHNLRNEFSLHSGVPDKRPPMYPVVLSMVHRVLGYSQINGFLLNGILGVMTLVLIGKIGQHFYPDKGAYIAILGMASLPLLSQNITSQHLEVLYLFLVSFLFLTCIRITFKDKVNELPLAYVLAAAIALTRYEGLIFFLIPFAAHLHMTWRGKAADGLLAAYFICPLSLIYLFTLVGYIFNIPKFWQLEDLHNTSAFGIHYWGQNFSALIDFLFSTTRSIPGSLPLSMLGLASLPMTLVYIFKSITEVKKDDGKAMAESISLVALLIALLLFLALIFSYHWGFVNSHLTARLLLVPYLIIGASVIYAFKREPFWLILIAALLTALSGIKSVAIDGTLPGFSFYLVLGSFIALAALINKGSSVDRKPQYLILFWVVFLLAETFPAINQRKYEESYLPIPRTKVFLDWVERYSGTNSMFISDSPYYGILAKESASSIERLRVNPERFLSMAGNNRFNNLYVMQEVGWTSEGRLIPFEGYQLPESIVCETVDHRRLVGDFGVRLLRITGLKSPPDEGPSE